MEKKAINPVDIVKKSHYRDGCNYRCISDFLAVYLCV